MELLTNCSNAYSNMRADAREVYLAHLVRPIQQLNKYGFDMRLRVKECTLTISLQPLTGPLGIAENHGVVNRDMS